jgi:DNA-binding transcriptional ArsR family regulator
MAKQTILRNREALSLIARRFKLLSEEARLLLLAALQDGGKNVTELVESTGLTQSNVSRHVKQLADAGILARKKDGLNVYYSIADKDIFRLCEVVCGSLQRDLGRQAELIR